MDTRKKYLFIAGLASLIALILSHFLMQTITRDRSDGTAEFQTLAVVGTSLSGNPLRPINLASALRSLLPAESIQVVNKSAYGDFLGDIFAKVIRSKQEGVDVNIIEMNPFVFNERKNLLAPGPTKIVVRDVLNIPTLFSVTSNDIRLELLKQNAIEPILGQVFLRHTHLFSLGEN